MEEEFDLRPYIKALWGRWYWIVSTTVLTVVAMYIFSWLLPPVYNATALVAVIDSKDVVQFDARFQETAENQPERAFPELATSDELLQIVMSQISFEDIEDVEQLREILTAESGNDIQLIRLSAMAKDPDEAAQLANIWAESFLKWANSVYSDLDQVSFFETQLAEAEAELAIAEEALIEFQAINRILLINNTLDSYNATQARYLTAQQDLAFLLQDTEALRRIINDSTHDSNSFANQLTALAIQVKAFSVDNVVPVEIAISDSIILTSDSRAEQIELLDDLAQSLQTQSKQINVKLAELQPLILDLQQQKQESETEYGRLQRDQSIAQETYLALARKVDEEKITSQSQNGGIRLASRANVPVKPINKPNLLNAIVAGVVGLMLGVISVWGFEWWKKSD